MKSPLKDIPLRNPGETLDRQINDLIIDKGLTYTIYMVFIGTLTFMEWLKWWQDIPPAPFIYSLILAITCLYYVPKVIAVRKQLKRLRQGRDGEKAVGQYLDSIKELDARVFHDGPAENFNLDHVVISSTGIYVIETKTYSKPPSGRPTIIFDGITVQINHKPKSDKPVIQAKAAANWLKLLLHDSTGKNYEIKPVVVFPGWFVEPTSEAKNSDVWVLNPRALPTFISNSKTRMKDDEVKMASFHLSRYIRTFDKKPNVSDNSENN